MYRYFYFIFATFLILGGLALTVQAEEGATAPVEDQDHLLGDLGGLRTKLSDSGVSVEAIVAADFFGVTQGGVSRDTGDAWNADLTVTIDTEQAGLWSGGTLFLYGLGNWHFSDLPSDAAGDLQGLSNIAAYSTAKLYEAWYNHDLFDQRLSLLVGLHDYASEFGVVEYGGLFLNSSFGVPANIAAVGPSIFPTTSLAGRIAVRPLDDWYFLTALYDGVPGDPARPRGTRIRFDDGDGLFWGNEIGMKADRESNECGYYKVGVGGWYHTHDYEDFGGRSRSSNSGIYGLVELSLWREEEQGRGLGAFFHGSFSDPDRNEVATYLGGGFNFEGLFASRPEDIAGLAFAHARNSSDFRRASEGLSSAETVVELSYRVPITSYFAIQPDIQWIINPGTAQGVDDALVIGIRSEVAL